MIITSNDSISLVGMFKPHKRLHQKLFHEAEFPELVKGSKKGSNFTKPNSHNHLIIREKEDKIYPQKTTVTQNQYNRWL